MKLSVLFGASMAQTVEITEPVDAEHAATTVAPIPWYVNLQNKRVDWYTEHCVTGNPKEREDCGYPGIKADECARQKCCWDDQTPGVPFCYQSYRNIKRLNANAPSIRTKQLDLECPADPSDRRNCGFNGINEDQCASLGCCYDTSVPRVPWCFHKKEYLPEDVKINGLVRNTFKKNNFCPKPAAIGVRGVSFSCTDGFRHGSICKLWCTNGISEQGKTYEFTCRTEYKQTAPLWISCSERSFDENPMICDDAPVLKNPLENNGNKISRFNGLSFGSQAFWSQFIISRWHQGGLCNAPATPENGFRNCRRVNNPDKIQFVCDFGCNDGYQMSGTDSRSCPTNMGMSNSWSGSPLTCSPPAVSAGRSEGVSSGPLLCPGMVYDDGNVAVDCQPGTYTTSLKERCQYRCVKPGGRLMRAPAKVGCNLDIDKMFHKITRPVCIHNICPSLETFNVNADCDNGVNNGSASFCQLSCDQGYRLVGEDRVTCEGANWSPKVPQCVPESLFGEGQCQLDVSTTQFGSPSGKRKRRVAGSATSVLNNVATFQVAIYDGDKFKCGGTLISDLWVLTAAHCIKKSRDIKVYGNVQSANRRDDANELGVAKLVPYPTYNGLAQWDIGLIKISKTVDNFQVQDLACLPPTSDYEPPSPEYSKRGIPVSVFGYGSVRVERNIFPDTMKRGTLAYTPHDHCPFIRRRNDAENLFCARHENSASAACEGDSGGPVTYDLQPETPGSPGKTYLVGVTASGRCGSTKPGLYVRVSKFIDWIHETIGIRE